MRKLGTQAWSTNRLKRLSSRRKVHVTDTGLAAVTAGDARHLRHLRDSLGTKFARGFVFHTGPDTFALDDRIIAAPISALWA